MGTKEILDSVEETLDVIEDQLDILEDGVKVVKGTKLVVFGIAVASCALGAAVTYLVINKRLQKKYDEQSVVDAEKARVFYAQRYKVGEYADPVALNETLSATRPVSEEDPDLKMVQKITRSYQSDHIAEAQEKVSEGVTEAVIETGIPIETVNVFTQSEEDFNYEEELKHRGMEEPYVITRQEFDAGEQEYSQSELTYYDGDDVLSDDRGSPIQDTDNVVGDNNLLKFGHGSGNPNIVYIRNEKLEIDIEVSKHDGLYTEQVLGLQHSDKRPLRRMRSTDE